MTPFNIRNWYWVIADDRTKVWSSTRACLIDVTDADFVAFTSAASPTRIGSIAELAEVFVDAGFNRGMPSVYLAARRFEVETGGIAFGEGRIATDRESQAMISGAAAYVNLDPSATVKFKMDDGSFAVLDRQGVLAVALAVAQHVQKCFAVEALIAQRIREGGVTTIDAVDVALSEEF